MAELVRTWQPRIVTQDESDTLRLGVGYERLLVSRLCESPKLWALVGEHLRPEWLQDPTSKLVLQAARAVARGTGHGPTAVGTVTRQLRNLQFERGQIEKSQLTAALDMLAEYEPERCPSDDEFAQQVGRAVRDKLKGMAIDDILAARGRDPDADLTKLTRKLSDIESIGRVAQVWNNSNVYDESIWAKIDQLQRTDKLPLGIPELDSELDGGIYRQSLVVYGADSNVGKSHAILHTGLNASLLGYRVIYVPTEQSVPANLVRSVAWLTGCKTEDVVRKTPQVLSRWSEYQQSPSCGHGPIEFVFLPKGGTPQQLRELIQHVLDSSPQMAGGWDVLCVDIADRMTAGNRAKGTYDDMGDVYEELISMAQENNGWTITGSQLKDRNGRKGPPTINDFADSRHKGRICSSAIMMWCDEDVPDLRWYSVAKARDQRVGAVVGPLPTALECGQIYPRKYSARPKM